MSLDTFGGRKFLAMLVGMVAGIAVELKGQRGLSMEMTTLITVLVGTFCGANALTTVKSAQSNGDGAEPQSLDASVVANSVSDNLKGHVEGLQDSQLQVKGALESVMQGQANLQKGMAALISGRLGQ